MNKLLATLIAGFVFALPLAALAGPDASQQALIQKAMQEHMKLMNEMISQMSGEHHMMMQGMNMQGMGKM